MNDIEELSDALTEMELRARHERQVLENRIKLIEQVLERIARVLMGVEP